MALGWLIYVWSMEHVVNSEPKHCKLLQVKGHIRLRGGKKLARLVVRAALF